MALWVSGRRAAVHEDRGVSRAGWPLFNGRCQVNSSPTGQYPPRQITAEEFAEIARDQPRRLCAHDFRTQDR